MRHWILGLAALCVGATAQAQNVGRITGTVTAADDGRPLSGANITVMGTVRTAFTNAEGAYVIEQVPTGTQQVRVRYLGFAPITLPAAVQRGQTLTLNFQLVAAPIQLEGVVVTAYGEQQRRDVTGSITSLSVGDLKDLPMPDPAQLLQARVPGVDVVAGSGYRPGAPMQVTIRGMRSMSASNEPLYVVDGVPIPGGIQDFDPGSIQSIEVLKDASATAPYGIAAANGVILITTKRGGASGSRFTYDYQIGTSSALRLVQMMNGPQLMAERIEAYRSAGRDTALTSVFTPDELPAVYCILDPAYRAAHPGCSTGTDWQRSILRDGSQQRHQIGFTSTSGASRLSLTGTYLKQNGITVGQGYDQYSGTVSFENTYGRLRLGVTATGSRSIANIGGDAQLWSEALANNPLGMPYDSAGSPWPRLCSICTLKIKPTPDPLRTNPLLEEQGYVRQQTRNRLFGSLFGEVELGRGFRYRVNFGPDLSNRMDGQFQAANVVVGSTPLGNAQAQRLDEEVFTYQLDNILTWNFDRGDHRADVTMLYNIKSYHYTSTTASARNLPYDYQLWYNLNTGDDPQAPQSSLRVYTGRSYMGRLNYTYRNRYSVTVTGRFDGASVFAPGHKWSFFPSTGLSWQLGDERFMRPLSSVISGLKLRASWGVTGNSAINPYQTEGSLNRTTYNFGSGSAAGYVPGSIPNPDLLWEKTTQVNFGVDFGFLRNRISGSLDVYRERTSDLLLQRQLPASTGFTQTLQNIGKTGNAGWELSVTTVNLPGSRGGPRWTTDFNFTHNKNYIISLSGGVGDDVGNRWFIGQPINIGGATNTDALHNLFYDLEFVGIWQLADSALARSYGQAPGDIRVADLNGDGKIDGADRVIRGNTYPDLIANIYNRLNWGHFDFSVLLQGRTGYTMRDGFAAGAKLFERYNFVNVQYWTPQKCDGGPDPNAYDPVAGMTAAQLAAIPGCNSNPVPSAGRENPLYNDVNYSVTAYRSGTHWRVRNITVGYTLPDRFLQRYGFSSLRIYAVAQDPFVITPYYGYDPENGSASGPPSYRTLLIGATVGF
jgi:TonB-linked SusC/RagA family outer membrane protein